MSGCLDSINGGSHFNALKVVLYSFWTNVYVILVMQNCLIKPDSVWTWKAAHSVFFSLSPLVFSRLGSHHCYAAPPLGARNTNRDHLVRWAQCNSCACLVLQSVSIVCTQIWSWHRFDIVGKVNLYWFLVLRFDWVMMQSRSVDYDTNCINQPLSVVKYHNCQHELCHSQRWRLGRMIHKWPIWQSNYNN